MTTTITPPTTGPSANTLSAARRSIRKTWTGHEAAERRQIAMEKQLRLFSGIIAPNDSCRAS